MQFADVGTLGTWGTVLAIMSTIVGGGMLGIPWACFNCGFYLTIAFGFMASVQVVLSSILFLRAREMCPDHPQSMFEIGFLLLGRVSIFWICTVILVNSFGLLIIFFNTFGNICANVVKTLIWSDVPEGEENFGMKMECWVLVLAVCLLPSVFMKELAELKILSIALFVAALVFVSSNLLELLIVGQENRNPDSSYS